MIFGRYGIHMFIGAKVWWDTLQRSVETTSYPRLQMSMYVLNMRFVRSQRMNGRSIQAEVFHGPVGVPTQLRVQAGQGLSICL